ncbi:MAG: DUF350 domain-containing protein [Nocardiopsaceae bacterium]|nr:DUF350 domain-containing protein [Nocardiopsaceae bacterium]
MYLLTEAASGLAYGGVGIVLMILGFLIVDVLTPGRLHNLIWEQRNRNAALLAASNLLGVAIVVTVAIWVSEAGLVQGLLSTAVYGAVGLMLMGLSFLLIDLFIPVKLGKLLTQDEPHPAAWISAAAHIGIALMVAAAIS